MNLLTFIVLALAVWRISSLLVNEDGPFRIFEYLRWTAAHFTELFTCTWCTSLWLGIVVTVAYWYAPDHTATACLPFALSAGAIMWDRWSQ